MESAAKILPAPDIKYAYENSEGKPYLKKDGTPRKIVTNNKKAGKKSEVYPIEYEDMKRITAYFRENEMWCQYLIFVLSCNTARRIGDLLSLVWKQIFNEKNGKMLDYLGLLEEKTQKLTSLKINSACEEAIRLYIEKTGIDPFENLNAPVFVQTKGTHKGSPMSYNGYYQSLKKAAEFLEIPYNIGAHSPRKTFGKISRMLHPNDPDSMQLLQGILRHSDENTTRRYIGLTKEKEDAYFDDFGSFFDKYVTGDETYVSQKTGVTITITTNDLRDLIKIAYQNGFKDSREETLSPTASMDAMSELMELAESLAL